MCACAFVHLCSPHNLVLFADLSGPVFAVVVVVVELGGLLLVAPLQHLALGLTVGRGVRVLQITWFTVERVGNETQIPLLVLLEAD